MKKLLVLVCGFILMSLPCGATTMVHYNIAGVPTHVTYGAGHRMSANPYGFGSNAAFTPRNTRLAGERMRMQKLQQTMAENGRAIRVYGPDRNLIRPQTVSNQLSTLSRDYRVPKLKSYVRNGIICYE